LLMEGARLLDEANDPTGATRVRRDSQQPANVVKTTTPTDDNWD